MKPMTMEHFEHFFAPHSVAIVGASSRTGPGTYNVVENLIDDGCGVELYPVNVKGGTLLGRKVYRSVSELPKRVDLAVISVQRQHVVEVVRECVTQGIKALVIITQGFSDADETGRQLERQVLEATAGSDTRFIGPNSIGLVNAFDTFHTSFQRFDLEPRSSALICQSGMFLLGSADFTGGAGFAVDVGNAADLGFAELLPWLARDPRVRVINLHMEGIADGEALFESAGRITREKPVLAFKVGTSDEGARAVQSHSGALAGDDKALNAGFEKAGILRVESVEHWRDLNKVLLTYPGIKGRRFAVLTLSGGGGIVMVDALRKFGLEVARLSPVVQAKLKEMCPAWLEVGNPIDTWMAALRHGLAEATVEMLNILVDDEQVDGVIVLLNCYKATGLESLSALVDGAVAQASARRDKPVVFWAFGANQNQVIDEAEKSGVVSGFTSPLRIARALAGLCDYHLEVKGRPQERLPTFDNVERERAEAPLSSSTCLLGAEALDVIAAYGIRTAGTFFAANLVDALRVAQEVGYPLVLKVASQSVVHKSESGGVALNIKDSDELARRYQEVTGSVRRHRGASAVDGVLLQRYHLGVETIVGARRHPGLGAVIVFGLGGIYTEVLEDVAFCLAPCSEREARKMIENIRGHSILAGARGGEVVNKEAIVDAICRVSRLACDFDAIAELDINPLVASADGVLAVDARIVC